MTRLAVVPPVRFLPAQITPIDVLTGFTDNDYITVAFPDFDLANIDVAASYMDVTSNSTGNFDLGPTDSVALVSSLVPLTQGDSEFRFYRSYLTSVNKQALTGIRFRITALHATTFKVAAIRCINQNWTWAPLDLNTLHQRIATPVSLDGNPNNFSGFPVDVDNELWPVLWRSDAPSSGLDPRPIDSTMSMFFYSGSLTQTGRVDGAYVTYNEISMYFREAHEASLTQLDLSGSYTQAQLDALGNQPDYGVSLVSPRTQASLDVIRQNDLDFQTQSQLESVANFSETSWLKVAMKWDQNGASLDVRDHLDNGYTLMDLPISAKSYYLLRVTCQEHTLQVQCFPADDLGNITWDPIFDSGELIDSFTFERRQGRFGWHASFADGDAYIDNVRTWGLNFAEYRSHEFRSNTPVRGARLQVGGLLNRDLYSGIKAAPWGGALSLDQTKSSSGAAILVNNSQSLPLSGAITNQLYFDDWEETTIHFNLFFPASAKNSPLTMFLMGENARIIPLTIPKFSFDKWQSLKVKLRTYCNTYQPGYYQVAWVQTNVGTPTVWWLDQIHVYAKMTRWAARAKQEDAWSMIPVPFVPFEETVNADGGGIVFDRGTHFQTQAKARRQDARIPSIKAIPQYATLGNFAWTDEKPTLVQPTPTFSYSGSHLTQAFVDTSTDAGTPPGIIFREWNFGDEATDYGPTPTHIYAQPGSYTVSLQIVNRQGQRNSVSQTITVNA